MITLCYNNGNTEVFSSSSLSYIPLNAEDIAKVELFQVPDYSPLSKYNGRLRLHIPASKYLTELDDTSLRYYGSHSDDRVCLARSDDLDLLEQLLEMPEGRLVQFSLAGSLK